MIRRRPEAFTATLDTGERLSPPLQPVTASAIAGRPEALAAAIVGAAGDCIEACRTTLETLALQREQLRERLRHRLKQAPDGLVRPLGAVDGTQAVVATAGATFVALAAVAVAEDRIAEQDARVFLLPPVEELSGLLGGLRAMMELRLLARQIRAQPKGLWLLDGSFWSMLLEINALVVRYAQDHAHGNRPPWWEHFRPLLAEFFAERDWLTVLESRRVAAHPKGASASDEVLRLAPELAATCSDRTLFGTLLEPGEYAVPVPLLRNDRPHLLTGYRDAGIEGLAEQRLAIERAYGQLYVLYYRPDDGPAYRIELPAPLIAREPLGAVLATFRAGLRGRPAVLEPLPQFLADALLREVGRALQATVESTHNRLRLLCERDLVERYLGPGRTPRTF